MVTPGRCERGSSEQEARKYNNNNNYNYNNLLYNTQDPFISFRVFPRSMLWTATFLLIKTLALSDFVKNVLYPAVLQWSQIDCNSYNIYILLFTSINCLLIKIILLYYYYYIFNIFYYYYFKALIIKAEYNRKL